MRNQYVSQRTSYLVVPSVAALCLVLASAPLDARPGRNGDGVLGGVGRTAARPFPASPGLPGLPPSTTRGLVNADASLSALGPRGVQADVDATVASRAQPADLDATARIGGPQAARADVAVGRRWTAGRGSRWRLSIGSSGGGIPGSGDPGGGTPGAGDTGGISGGPGGMPGGSSASTGSQPGRGGVARAASASTRSNDGTGDMALKKTRCVGVLSDARSFDPGIVAFRSLIGG